MTELRIGFIGLGNMGGRMTGCITETGREVLGFDAAHRQHRGARRQTRRLGRARSPTAATSCCSRCPTARSSKRSCSATTACSHTPATGRSSSTSAPRPRSRRARSPRDSPPRARAISTPASPVAPPPPRRARSRSWWAATRPHWSGHARCSDSSPPKIFHMGDERRRPHDQAAQQLPQRGRPVRHRRGDGRGEEGRASTSTTLLDVINDSSGVNFATLNRFPKIIKGDYLKGGLTNALMIKDVLALHRARRSARRRQPQRVGAARRASAWPRGSATPTRSATRVVDAIGDVSGGVRLHDPKRTRDARSSTNCSSSHGRSGTASASRARSSPAPCARTDLPATDGVTINTVVFTPGARTYWHSHERGQILQVLAGRGLVCSEGDAPVVIGAGDTVWVPAGRAALARRAPRRLMSHTAISLGTTNWDNEVSDDDYRAPAVSRRTETPVTDEDAHHDRRGTTGSSRHDRHARRHVRTRLAVRKEVLGDAHVQRSLGRGHRLLPADPGTGDRVLLGRGLGPRRHRPAHPQHAQPRDADRAEPLARTRRARARRDQQRCHRPPRSRRCCCRPPIYVGAPAALESFRVGGEGAHGDGGQWLSSVPTARRSVSSGSATWARPMAPRLVEAGYTVLGFDLPEAAAGQRLAGHGGRVAADGRRTGQAPTS